MNIYTDKYGESWFLSDVDVTRLYARPGTFIPFRRSRVHVPSWVVKWLSAYGLSVEGFKAKLLELADKIDAPEEWKTQISMWIDEHTTINAETVLAFVALVYAELRSGAPGYNRDAGGLA